MIVCLCHPFSDKTAKAHMEGKGRRCSVGEVYATCSGGEKPNCCQCLETLKDMVKTHNTSMPA